MHAVVMDSLEDYLSGLLNPRELRKIEAHLNGCERCRTAIRELQDVSLLVGALAVKETGWEPSPAFFAGVMEKARPTPAPSSFASFFDMAFGRRLVFASLLTLAVTGSYLVSHESEAPTGMSPAAILAQQGAPGFDSAPAPDNMLVTLTAYER